MTSFSSDFENPRPPPRQCLSTNNCGSPTRNLTRGSGADLSFVVLQKLDVMSDQLLADEVLPNGLCQLMKQVKGPGRAEDPKHSPR